MNKSLLNIFLVEAFYQIRDSKRQEYTESLSAQIQINRIDHFDGMGAMSSDGEITRF